MWQIFGNSKIAPFGCELKVRDYNRDKREGREEFLSLDREEIL